MKQQLHRLLLAAGLGVLVLTSLAQTPPAQIRVVDARTNLPIPYASIGVRGRPLGTVTDAAGTFPLAQLGPAAAADTVVVSCVGYGPQKLLAGQLRPETELRLTPQAARLAEVVVRGRQPRRIVLGHSWVSAFTMLNFYTQADTVAHARLGREMGPLLKLKHPAQLESFHVFTDSRDFETVTFRLNLYAVQDGVPQQSLLSRDILFELSAQRRGWTALDLRPYAITLAGPQEVVATVQWLTSTARRADAKFLHIPAHLSVLHTTFMRDKSGQIWRKLGVNPSFYFRALSYPE